jgi:multidrug resistance efflux pump
MVNVGAGADGVLKEVRVREGQMVSVGEALALIDCSDLEADLQAARAAAESARQSRQRLLRGSREEERRLAADQRAVAEAIQQQAKLQDQRIEKLYHSGDVSREAWEKARRDLEVAEATLRAAIDHQSLVEALPLPEELAKADAEVRAAEERGKTVTAKLGRCTVRAPISGTVLRTYMKAGESVSTVFPQPIVSIGDLSRLRVRAEVDERDVGRIHLGQRVIVSADAFPEKKFAGQVSSLGALMGRKRVRTGDPAEKSDRDVLEVLVDLEEVEARLAVGLRTTVQFLRK